MIKTILTATDFSEVSMNAVKYAAGMAKHIGAKLVLLNVYFNNDMELRIPELMPTVDSMKEYSLDELKKISNQLHIEFGDDLDIEFEGADGFTLAEITRVANEKGADMVVVGSTGAGTLPERFIGSVASGLMHKSSLPVMVIHKNMIFKPIKKMVLACDYVEMKAETVLKPLKELADFFHAQILVLHAAPSFELVANEAEKEKVKAVLSDIPCLFYTIEKGDLVEKINSFSLQHEADLVVMIPHHHLFIDKLLFEPDTKRMAFNSVTPLLALHEA